MIQHTDVQYGPDSTNRLSEASDSSVDGARASVESFYYALNGQDLEVLRAVWAEDALAQLNNPVGGVVRGGDAVVSLYEQIFHGPVRLQVTLTDIVEYVGDRHAVFAGREQGSYSTDSGEPVDLQIRTTRYFRYEDGQWRQYHHHGSIDDAAALAAYQDAISTD